MINVPCIPWTNIHHIGNLATIRYKVKSTLKMTQKFNFSHKYHIEQLMMLVR
jgi:hypothetical protein